MSYPRHIVNSKNEPSSVYYLFQWTNWKWTTGDYNWRYSSWNISQNFIQCSIDCIWLLNFQVIWNESFVDLANFAVIVSNLTWFISIHHCSERYITHWLDDHQLIHHNYFSPQNDWRNLFRNSGVADSKRFSKRKISLFSSEVFGLKSIKDQVWISKQRVHKWLL